ncbi:conjugal transfer protein TraD [Sphingomonas sp.]|uniref:conjugal transfer protein TraD n=1 Tax=Sphingomonas sp. TaxID=28214 RepID=UPI001B2BDEDB|nr:conjugal transfer protein TraD [Sphingomonas sp.]MBO9712162.1 conjugal transfer protein TraD [Sphingomonas sp.]
MRKPRDYDSELKALGDKAQQLKARKLHQLGELVIATGADALPPEQLAGALLAATDTKDRATKEGWRKRGATFFQGAARNAAGGDRRDTRGADANDRGAASPSSQDRA